MESSRRSVSRSSPMSISFFASRLALLAFTSQGLLAQNGQWAWMGGSDVLPQTGAASGYWNCSVNECGLAGIYGVQYQFAPANNPGGREAAATWTDKSGRFWLFGGYGIGAGMNGVEGEGGWGFLNDLWVFDPAEGAHGEWAWIGGNDEIKGQNLGTAGTYGTLYDFAESNFPGSRWSSASWTDHDGRLWLFGGQGFDSAGNSVYLNDLWVFDPTQGAHGEWAWMGGGKTVPITVANCPIGNTSQCGLRGDYGAEYRYSVGNAPGSRCLAAAWTDSSGRLWLYGGLGFDSAGNGDGDLSDLWVFDPAEGAHGEWAWMGGSKIWLEVPVHGTEHEFLPANGPGARDSATSWIDAVNRLWLFGGNVYQSEQTQSWLNDLWVFDPAQGEHGEWEWVSGSSSWTQLAWGPPGIYGTKYRFGPANTPGGRRDAQSWTDQNGRLWLLGGFGATVDEGDGYLNDLWEFDPAQGEYGEWAWMGGSDNITYDYCYGPCGMPGIYGTEFEAGSANVPGGRQSAMVWNGGNGRIWLYGGFGSDSKLVLGWLNDLWKFDIPTLKHQTIKFAQPATPVIYGAKPIDLSATASSGLPVTFAAVSRACKTSGPNGIELAFTGTGTCVVEASQAGNSTYAAAPQVTRSIVVKPATLEFTAENQTMQYGAPVPKLTYTVSGFVNGDTAARSFTGKPALATTATSTSAPGNYPITIARGTLKAANYTFKFKDGTLTVDASGTAALPTFDPPQGTYSGAQSVTISDATAGAVIYYTTDGSTPSATHGTLYAAALTVSNSETVMAIAVEAGYSSSAIATAAYTIQ